MQTDINFEMELDRRSSPVNFTPESAQLEKALREKHHHGAEGEGTDVTWVASEDFTVEAGRRQIGDYIQTWQLPPRWLYSLDFLYSTEEGRHAVYHYRARFSAPTPQRPIGGTASVYFAVAVPGDAPQTRPAEVLFAVESGRLAHTPGKTSFRETWLTDVIESKVTLRKAVDL